MTEHREQREPWPRWLVVLVTVAVMVLLAGCVAVLAYPVQLDPTR